MEAQHAKNATRACTPQTHDAYTQAKESAQAQTRSGLACTDPQNRTHTARVKTCTQRTRTCMVPCTNKASRLCLLTGLEPTAGRRPTSSWISCVTRCTGGHAHMHKRMMHRLWPVLSAGPPGHGCAVSRTTQDKSQTCTSLHAMKEFTASAGRSYGCVHPAFTGRTAAVIAAVAVRAAAAAAAAMMMTCFALPLACRQSHKQQ